ncbi:hypothetical protein EDB83DRAFT_960416 [Lactarius deliciosus]|nr:hypothetical protein EDB83DRAFT_960416 [Lactarius deliciosus]
MLGKRKERVTNSPTPNLNNEGDTAAPQSGYAVARQLVLEELDLEIRVRQRLKETIESRIGWATCLQTSLNAVREDQGSESTVDTTGTNVFQLAATDALHVAETPILPILSRESRFPSGFTSEAIPTPPATSSTNPYARPYTRLARSRRSPSSIRPAPQHIYIRDSSTNTIARLACPDCARGDFPRVQSLLNHCRIQHGREFGSHDECIRGCAVQVPADEEAWVIENGSELRNVSLPSLRRLFEMAVGDVGSPLEISPVNDAPSVHQDVSPEHITMSGRETLRSSAPTHASTHLSRTLGHHVDTPALAPFLGRAPKRRSITTYDEYASVDIDGSPHVTPGRRWRIPLTHRSRARPALDLIIPVDASLPQLTPHVAPVTQGTRFHIVSRVTISDRSLWIPIDRRSVTVPEQTHRWCLSIEAPTYSLPLGAVLEHATITCLSPNPPPTRALDEPLKVSGPPFFACGTTSQPFLARLRFQWTSGSLNSPLEVEHWVELDMLHTNTPVLGDEQVLDVELDRNTVFRQIPPSKHGLDPWNLDSESLPASPKPVPALPGYITLLRSLVPVFPLTLRDLKGRSSTLLPYKLVSSPAQFRAFVPGRRKAIEWTRARALREAYEKAREEQTPAEEYPQLSTGEVFTWLRDAGLSLRRAVPPSAPTAAPTEKRISERIMPSAADTFCPACGLDSAKHPPREAPNSGPSCPLSSTSQLPLLDVGSCISAQSQPTRYTPAQQRPFHWSPRDVLAVTDPTLNFAVRSILFSLKLSCFQKSQGEASISGGGGLCPNGIAITPRTADRSTRGRVDFPPNIEHEFTSLTASAILALSVREFARCLVQSAVTAFASDRARIRGNLRAVIAQAHVARGLVGPFLARDGVLAGLPAAQAPPVALALSTLAQLPRKDLL